MTGDPSSVNLPASIVFLVLFALLAIITTYLEFRHGAHTAFAALTFGLLLEVLGHVGRILIAQNGFKDGTVFLALFCVLAPSFICSSAYLTSSKRFGMLGLIPHGLILVAGVLEVVGIALLAFGHQPDVASKVVAGGLGVQAVSIFGYLLTQFGNLVNDKDDRATEIKDYPSVSETRSHQSTRVNQVTSLLMLGISIYGIISMARGPSSSLFQSEAGFQIAFAAIPFVACTLLAICHSGMTTDSQTILPTLWQRRNRQRPSAVISSPLALVDNAHHRYNPDIRRQLSPASPHSYRSQMSAKGKSPGLPPNPRPSSKTTSPMSSAHSTPALDKRFSERPERPERALPPTKEDLVDKEALW